MESILTEPLLDAKDVRKILRCSLPLIYKMADRGQIPCVRIPCTVSEKPAEDKKQTKNIKKTKERKPKTLVRFVKADVLSFIEKYYENGLKNIRN
jgi:hypothetical protein